MKKDLNTASPQDSSHNHGQNHSANTPRIVKDSQNKEDRRKEVRQEHTNHFTNREGHPEKK